MISVNLIQGKQKKDATKFWTGILVTIDDKKYYIFPRRKKDMEEIVASGVLGQPLNHEDVKKEK